MAIYRKGQVSLDAQGYLTGYGTKWKASLTLIRPGATIVIASNPVIYGVVAEVINDTSIRLINFGKATAARSDYVILLHDSLTVDGLAQDVAETLRYYQGKETEFAHLIEVIKGLDYEKIEELYQRIKKESDDFEKNLAEIDKRVEQTRTYSNQAQQSARDAAARKDEVSILRTQTEDLKNQAAQQATAAAQQVALAKAEVQLAKAEVQKAEGEAVKANKEFIKAKAEATLAQQIVAGAKLEVVNEAKVEVERARNEADRAQGVVNNAKQELREEIQVQVDSATEQADRARSEADRAAQLADQMDTTKVMLKDKNLSDVSDLNTARQNMKVDRLLQDSNMTRIKSSDARTELRIGYDDWFVYRDSHDSEAGYVALPVKGGGTGGSTPLEAREGLELERFRQHAKRTEMATANGEYRLFVGDDGDWGALNRQSDHVALPVRAGGTGAKDAAGARLSINVDRLVQGSTSTTVGKANGNRLAINDGGEWGALNASNNWIALAVGKGGTGATDVDGARNNLELGKNQTVKFANLQLDSRAGNPLLIKSANPCIRFEETDVPSGRATAYMLVMDGGNIRMQENDTGTGDEVFSYESSNNTMKLPKVLFRDIAGTRKGLSLDVTDTATFSQVRAPNGVICTTESNSTNDNPSAPFVTQLRAADKTTIVSQGEFRADRNGNVSIINRAGASASSPQFATLAQNGDFTVPTLISSRGIEGNYLEIGYRGKNSPAYVDFHYSGKYDYDARIICDGMNSDQAGGGNLRFYAGYINMNAKSSYSISGGRFTISTSDVNVDTQMWVKRDASPIVLQNKTTGYANYILSKDVGGGDLWYVGRGGNNNDMVSLHNYKFNTAVQLRQGDVYVNKDITSQGNIICNGSSLYVDGGSGSGSTHLWLRNTSKKSRAVIYSNDSTQALFLRSDNPGAGTQGQSLSINGATGECRAAKFTATSDERAKFWIKPVTGALDKICQLRGVTYSMHTTIQNTVRNAGVIAQDVQKVLPEAVTVQTNKEHGVIDKACRTVENPLSLDYNAMSALYVEAFKEMRDLIEAQKAEIESLKSTVASMQLATFN